MDPLDLEKRPFIDERINKIEYHAILPYTTNLNKGDEVRILIQQQDLCIKPSDSYLLIDVEIPHLPPPPKVSEFKIYHNGLMFMFDQIRYELNGIEIDRCTNPGITSCLKQYATAEQFVNNVVFQSGIEWKTKMDSSNGHFQFTVPLNIIFGFAEDYQRVMIDARHEIIMTLASDVSRIGSFVGETFKVKSIQWRVPNYYLNDFEKLRMLKILDSGKYLSIPFRSWELYELPFLPKTTKFNWNIKTSSSLERPRYVIFGMQTDRSKPVNKDTGHFQQCDLNNFNLYLNSQTYPYENLNLNFEKLHDAVLYEMYLEFRRSYFQKNKYTNSYLNFFDFTDNAPIVCIDVSRQNETIKSGPVDVRIDFELRKDVPDNTRAFCLLIHDRIVEYSPLTTITRIVV